MKATVYRSYGPPDVVTVGEVPRPVPREDEILVRVHAATVGIVDSLARRGTSPAILMQMPWTARSIESAMGVVRGVGLVLREVGGAGG